MAARNNKNNENKLESVRSKLKLKNIRTVSEIHSKHSKVSRVLKDKDITAKSLRDKSARILGTSLVAGSILLNIGKGGKNLPTPKDIIESSKIFEKDKMAGDNKEVSPQAVLFDSLSMILPEKTRPLYRNEEKLLENIISELTGIKVKATLEGEHLNTTYGKIGAEQHLRRYPGDTLNQHGSLEDQKEGIAPGLGAWGYFASSKDKLDENLVEKEKWYAVVQTLYLNDWNSRQPYLRDWYKYRKVMIVNTSNGKAIVAAIADSGPAAWTGKSFGGSPEVMNYLGGARYKKGPVLVFFVDDPENKVPLGPVDYDNVNVSTLSMNAT